MTNSRAYSKGRATARGKRLEPGEHVTVSAKEAMGDILDAMGFEPGKFAIFDIWDREIKGIIKGCDAVAVQGNRLCVKVPSVVHRQELMYSKERLIKKVNQALGKKIITDIRFELSNGQTSENKGGTLRAENPRRKWNRSFGKRDG